MNAGQKHRIVKVAMENQERQFESNYRKVMNPNRVLQRDD
jgi:hypothetical protein